MNEAKEICQPGAGACRGRGAAGRLWEQGPCRGKNEPKQEKEKVTVALFVITSAMVMSRNRMVIKTAAVNKLSKPLPLCRDATFEFRAACLDERRCFPYRHRSFAKFPADQVHHTMPRTSPQYKRLLRPVVLAPESTCTAGRFYGGTTAGGPGRRPGRRYSGSGGG